MRQVRHTPGLPAAVATPDPRMSSITPHAFGAFVVEAAFLGEVAAFALGDGTVRLATAADVATADVHAGAILAATADGAARLLTGGDDYQTLFTAPESARGAIAGSGLGVTRIGKAMQGRGVHLLDSAGNELVAPRGGWSHFTS